MSTSNVVMVYNNNQLRSALSVAESGTTIALAPGDYSNVWVKNFTSSTNVTITSLDPAAPAHVDGFNLFNVAGLNIANLEVGRALLPGETVSTAFISLNRCSDIGLYDLDVHGGRNGITGDDGYGMRVLGSSGITVAECHFDALYRAAVFSRSSDIVATGNDVTDTREGFDFANVHNVVIEKNLFHDLSPDLANGDHPDCIQFMTAGIGGSSHILIRDNAMLNGGSDAVQGIFLRSTDETMRYSDVTITNNVYYGGSRHGITPTSVDGLLVAGNTIVASGTPTLVPAINSWGNTAARFTANIAPLFLMDGVNTPPFDDNLTTYSAKSVHGKALAAVFLDPTTDTDVTPEDFVVRDSVTAGFHMTDGIGGEDLDPLARLDDYAVLHWLALSLGNPLV